MVIDSLSESEVSCLAVNRHVLPGVLVVNQLVRFYPYGEIAAHAVGSVRRMTDDDLCRVDPVGSATTFTVSAVSRRSMKSSCMGLWAIKRLKPMRSAE